MRGLSNLPPGCTSADGGIDHEFENAIEDLVEVIPSIEIARGLKFLILGVADIQRFAFAEGRQEGLMDASELGRVAPLLQKLLTYVTEEDMMLEDRLFLHMVADRIKEDVPPLAGLNRQQRLRSERDDETCEVCNNDRYLVMTRSDGCDAVERCDECSNGVLTDEQAARLARFDGIECDMTYPCYMKRQLP